MKKTFPQFTDKEMAILGSCLAQKLGAKLKWKFMEYEALIYIPGNEDKIIAVIDSITQEGMDRFNIRNACKSLKRKLINYKEK